MTNTETPLFDYSQIGVPGEWRPFTVDRERMLAHARAVNDRDPARVVGDVGNPMFAVVPGATSTSEILRKVPSPALRGRGLLSEIDVRLYRSFEPGMQLRNRAVGLAVVPLPKGSVVTTRASTLQGDELVCEQYISLYFPGAHDAEAFGEVAPSLAPVDFGDATPTEVVSELEPDQPFLYAGASGDFTSIHIDNTDAQAVGFPGIILHGACTMGIVSTLLASVAATAPTDVVTRIAARLNLPVFPSDSIRTRFVSTPGSEGGQTIAFESETDRGLCLSRGILELATAY